MDQKDVANEVFDNQKNVFVVLGMPRSGTSAIARGLKALGINLGEHLIPANKDWNAKGYWEDSDVVRAINERILNIVCDEWESIKIIESSQLKTPSVDKIRVNAIELIKKRFGENLHWGFKDPRTARLLPFWQSIFTELNIKDNYVIVLRNPLASAHSFHKLTKVDIEKGLLLWLAHLIPSIDETWGKKRIMVSYNLMLADPLFQLDRIKNNIDIPLPDSAEAINEYAQGFLDKSLQHYEYTLEDLKSHPSSAIAPLCLRAYELFLSLARDEIHFDDTEFKLAWKQIKVDFEQIYPTYCYIDTLLKRNKELERSVRTMRKSLPWKLIYPLRLIDDKLREYRKKNRITA